MTTNYSHDIDMMANLTCQHHWQGVPESTLFLGVFGECVQGLAFEFGDSTKYIALPSEDEHIQFTQDSKWTKGKTENSSLFFT